MLMNLQSAFGAFSQSATQQPQQQPLFESKSEAQTVSQEVVEKPQYNSLKEQLFSERNALKIKHAVQSSQIKLTRRESARLHEITQDRNNELIKCTYRFVNLPLDATYGQLQQILEYVIGEGSDLKVVAVQTHSDPSTIYDHSTHKVISKQGFSSYPTKILQVQFSRELTDAEARKLKVLKFGQRVIFCQDTKKQFAELDQKRSIFVDRFKHNSDVNAIILKVMELVKQHDAQNRVNDARLFFADGVMRGCMLLQVEQQLSADAKLQLLEKEYDVDGEHFELHKCLPEKIARRRTELNDRKRKAAGEKVVRSDAFKSHTTYNRPENKKLSKHQVVRNSKFANK